MVFEVLTEWRPLWVLLHLFSMVLGLGGATYSDLLLFRFLRDYKISHKEADILRVMSRVVLTGIFLAFISGILLFLPESERLLQTPKFLVKAIVFFVLCLNGFLLHLLVLPRLIRFSFHRDHYLYKNMVHLRHLGFAMGAVSFTSWYTVFILGSLQVVPYSFSFLLSLYIVLLLMAVATALLLEYFVAKSVKNSSSFVP